ncbi:MAG: metal ABC transporter permease [Gemmataceae bacterium]|nr:metal ABC transporter permease [Gemmata sp.]MDW8196371.1 metal ABC transporter permease [Gemmataceae bacterium]
MNWSELLERLNTSALWEPALGTALLGLMAGTTGALAVVRRQSLMGDAVAHAALPGVAVAFLLGARAPLALVLGGAAAGWLAMQTVRLLTHRSRVSFDTALAGVLAVFFGAGLVLFTYIQRNVLGATLTPLERYLFGQAAFLRHDDLLLIGSFTTATLVIMMALWKPWATISFDPAFAASIGLPVRRLEWTLTTLQVLAVVIGLKAVGVVLMTALLIAPGVAARQWSHRLGFVVLGAGVFGAGAGLIGTLAAHLASFQFAKGRSVPTGPIIVLTATAWVVLSLLVGPARGWLWSKGWRRSRLPRPDPNAPTQP